MTRLGLSAAGRAATFWAVSGSSPIAAWWVALIGLAAEPSRSPAGGAWSRVGAGFRRGAVGRAEAGTAIIGAVGTPDWSSESSNSSVCPAGSLSLNPSPLGFTVHPLAQGANFLQRKQK